MSNIQHLTFRHLSYLHYLYFNILFCFSFFAHVLPRPPCTTRALLAPPHPSLESMPPPHPPPCRASTSPAVRARASSSFTIVAEASIDSAATPLPSRRRHQILSEEHWAFCYSILQVSRSFALVIQQLNPKLYRSLHPPAPIHSQGYLDPKRTTLD
jgi:hypothetical protein